jgi:uncharacterized phiE125 gp8 family phage protein
LNITHSADDTYIGALIDVAIAHLDGPEGYLRRALCTQTWKTYRADFPRTYPRAPWRLPAPPLQTVTAIQHIDRDGATQTVDASTYIVVAPHGGAGYIQLKDGETWPADVEDRADAISVEFVAGYGVAASVPKPIVQAMLLLIGEWYSNRGDNLEPAQMMKAPGLEVISGNYAAVHALLNPYKWREFA